MPLHRFCVHTLTTVYRTIETDGGTATTSQIQATASVASNPLAIALTNELRKLNEEAAAAAAANANANATANRSPDIITGNTLPSTSGLGHLLPLSESWLVAAALPSVFTRLQERKKPSLQKQQSESRMEPGMDGNSVAITNAPATPPISHLMSTIPTHWSLLAAPISLNLISEIGLIHGIIS